MVRQRSVCLKRLPGATQAVFPQPGNLYGKEYPMFENIVFILMVVIAAGAGIWVWWMECHGRSEDRSQENQKEIQGQEK